VIILLTMNKAVFISGFLYNLSDNIIPFLDKETDLFVHSWQTEDNQRWIKKLDRYKKYCNETTFMFTKPEHKRKRISYLQSTYYATSLIKDPYKYKSIVKFKPDLDIDTIEYKEDMSNSFRKAYLQNQPLLNDTTKEECVYGYIHYKAMDERIFTCYPYVIDKMFQDDGSKSYQDGFMKEAIKLDNKLQWWIAKEYEGSLLWKELFECYNIELIQDINLKLPNNKQWQ